MKTMRLGLLAWACSLALACVAWGAETSTSTEGKKLNTNEVAVLKTTLGEMVIEFWPDVAPKTVENFVTLAKKGFYDGTCFHRIIKGFMI